jgi:hypothetical protein
VTPRDDGLMSTSTRRALAWPVLLLAGAAIALLIVWLGHLVSLSSAQLLTAAVVVAGICWLVALVTVPWNLYFAARRAAADMTVSRERGISIRDANEAEAARIAVRMLRFALAAHLSTALAAAVIAYACAEPAGYYLAAAFLLATGIRPAVAYLAHVRERIRVLTRESTHPRADVASLEQQMADITVALRLVQEDVRRAESTLADDIAHARQLLTADLARLQDAQADDKSAARARVDALGRRIDDMVRRIEATLDGISDHQELLTGIRALVRMVRSDPA